MQSTIYGPLDLPNWPDDLIIRALHLLGEWGVVETEVFASLIPDGTVLWDCGAFVGTFSLGVARLSPLTSLLAIEANPMLLQYVQSNLERLAPCPATIVAGGVGASDGYLTKKFQEGEDNNLGAQEYTYAQDSSEALPIPCYALSSLREKHGSYDALKLDIEGMEMAAIKGDSAFLWKEMPLLWVECNERVESLHIFAAIKSLGYDLVYVAFPAFRRDNFNASDFILYPFAYEAALLAASPDVMPGLDWSGPEFTDVIVRQVRTEQDLRQAMFDTPRWGKKEWLHLSRAELVAQLSRALRDERIGSFLR